MGREEEERNSKDLNETPSAHLLVGLLRGWFVDLLLWFSCAHRSPQKTLFRTKLTEVVTSFAEKGYNVCLHTENKG